MIDKAAENIDLQHPLPLPALSADRLKEGSKLSLSVIIQLKKISLQQLYYLTLLIKKAFIKKGNSHGTLILCLGSKVFPSLKEACLPARQGVGVVFMLLLSLPSLHAKNNLTFKGQASAWGIFAPESNYSLNTGLRYIPQLNYEIPLKNKRLIDFEASVNVYGGIIADPFESVIDNGDIQPFRAWGRYSAKQFELRVGLQKINFGSASMIRPLRWFDQIDPRDPLQLTNGVWGALARYYFVNNANIWIWGLYGNSDLKGWEIIKTNKKFPEWGGRFQYPLGKGELALSYHNRTTNAQGFGLDSAHLARNPENRIGIDGKWDVGVGLWFESSYTRQAKDVGQFNNQFMSNIGVDYTFNIGNGLTTIAEQIFIAFDDKAFALENPIGFTALSATYPIGLFDNLTGMIYFDWLGESVAGFLNYQHDFKKFTGYIMAFWTPSNTPIIQQGNQDINQVNALTGKGIQLMVVYNH